VSSSFIVSSISLIISIAGPVSLVLTVAGAIDLILFKLSLRYSNNLGAFSLSFALPVPIQSAGITIVFHEALALDIASSTCFLNISKSASVK
jgi:hypothetical protein